MYQLMELAGAKGYDFDKCKQVLVYQRLGWSVRLWKTSTLNDVAYNFGTRDWSTFQLKIN